VLDLPGFGYALNLTNPVSAADGTANYMNASLARNGGEKEILLGRYFINAKQENGGRQGLFNGPNGYHNWAGNTPVQLMIDDYEMMDGSKFDWNKTEHASAPYTNRDPRFYLLSFMKVLHGNLVLLTLHLRIQRIKFRPGSIYCKMVALFLV